jgi:hypothetical protein
MWLDLIRFLQPGEKLPMRVSFYGFFTVTYSLHTKYICLFRKFCINLQLTYK